MMGTGMKMSAVLDQLLFVEELLPSSRTAQIWGTVGKRCMSQNLGPTNLNMIYNQIKNLKVPSSKDFEEAQVLLFPLPPIPQNVLSAATHFQAVFDAIDGFRVSLGPTKVLQYLLQGWVAGKYVTQVEAVEVYPEPIYVDRMHTC